MFENKLKGLYSDSYFKTRLGNDPKRLKSFILEKDFIYQYIKKGRLLDVGCSTGEFIDALQWTSETYGMEISEYAINIAKSKGIRFDRDLLNSESFFNIIVFRGTIQHIDTPFLYMKRAFDALQPGGYLFFLITPNANSIYYKLWNTLPFLDPPRNFFVPSDHSLINALKNFGFKFIEIRYPYWNSPYKSLIKDHINFLKKCFGSTVNFTFWHNSLNLCVRKPS